MQQSCMGEMSEFGDFGEEVARESAMITNVEQRSCYWVCKLLTLYLHRFTPLISQYAHESTCGD